MQRLADRTRSAHPLARTLARPLEALNGRWHRRALLVYLLVVAGHFAEHLVQAVQVYLLGWHPRVAGGILGLYLPRLAQNEILHVAYNSLQLTGLILLWPGFQRYRAARRWWNVALVAQSWHLFEHVLLISQVVGGSYLFGADRPTSLLETLVPRVQLHLTYNLLALIPTAVAVALYVRARRAER